MLFFMSDGEAEKPPAEGEILLYGKPLDWNDPRQMYRLVHDLPFESVEILGAGKRPGNMGATSLREWCPVVTGLHVRIAREILSAKGSSAEINARAFGPTVAPGPGNDGIQVNVGLVRK